MSKGRKTVRRVTRRRCPNCDGIGTTAILVYDKIKYETCTTCNGSTFISEVKKEKK